MKRTSALLAEFILMAMIPSFGLVAEAASLKSSPSSVATNSKASEIHKLSVKSAVKAPPKKETEKSWGLSSSYSFSSDLNKAADRRPSKHRLDYGVEYKLSAQWAASVGSNFKWSADGNNIRKTEDNPRADDLEISIGTNGKILPQLAYMLGISDSLPTGYESRTEAVRNTVSISGGLSHSFFEKKIKTGFELGATSIQQTYDYSITSGDSNPDAIYSAKFSVGYSLIEPLKIGFDYGIWSIHLINGENNLSRNQTSLGMSYLYKNFKFFTKYSIGNYDKNDGYKLLYFDDTRQVVSLGVAFEI